MGWPRLRLRALLILVALLAVALGIATIRWRRISYARAASFHARESERLNRESLSACLDELRAERYAPKRSAIEQERLREQSRSEWLQRLAEWHGQLSQRYERAAAHPWLPAGPYPAP